MAWPTPLRFLYAAHVRAYFRRRAGGAPLVALGAIRVYSDRRISIGPQPVAGTPEYMVCDPAPAPQLVAFNTDRVVHLGSAQYGPNTGTVSRTFDTVYFDAWLDRSVRGTVDPLPTATTDGGTVTVSNGNGGYQPPSEHIAVIAFDPRNANGRLAAGTHTITVTWHVTSGGRRQDFSATTRAVVRDDGTVTVGEPRDDGPHGDARLPLERRFGARITARNDAHDRDALVLSVESTVDEEAAYLWRATGGELTHTARSRQAVWTPPRERGRYLVTCAVQTGRSGA